MPNPHGGFPFVSNCRPSAHPFVCLHSFLVFMPQQDTRVTGAAMAGREAGVEGPGAPARHESSTVTSIDIEDGGDGQVQAKKDPAAGTEDMGEEKGRELQTHRSKSKRVAALDAFRGLTIVLMILVDDAGGAYERMDHSPWNGCTLADFVMPFFLFIVGVAIALAFKRIAQVPVAIRKIIIRTLKLLFWGVLLQGVAFLSLLTTIMALLPILLYLNYLFMLPILI
uniref:Heparan-alpha-glucosaminide N-acetyltransferase n=1 Tax=Anthurium amnicola TaxID=1678845 RepID=A0A1D1ZBT7_9ARAE